MELLIIILLIIGLGLLRISVRSKTAFVLLIALSVAMSFFIAIHALSLIGGIVIDVAVGLFIMWLDEQGSLA